MLVEVFQRGSTDVQFLQVWSPVFLDEEQLFLSDRRRICKENQLRTMMSQQPCGGGAFSVTGLFDCSGPLSLLVWVQSFFFLLTGTSSPTEVLPLTTSFRLLHPFDCDCRRGSRYEFSFKSSTPEVHL